MPAHRKKYCGKKPNGHTIDEMDVIAAEDYRESKAGKAMIAGIEALLIFAGRPVTASYITNRIAMPKGWNVCDLMLHSKHIVRHIRYPADLYAYEAEPKQLVLLGYDQIFTVRNVNRRLAPTYE